MRRKVSNIWKSSEGTEETRGAEGATGLGTWPTNVKGKRSKLKESREGGQGRIGGNR